MFGYLPAPCRCQVGDRVDLYRSAFCGLCNALAGQYGQPARLLINRDSTFVALLAAAQIPEAPVAALSTRCQPWRRPMPVFEAGPAPAFAAAVTLCGLQAKLDDERVDEHGLRAAACRLLSALSQSRFDRARATLAVSGFPVAEVWSQLARQARTEAEVVHGGDPARAAEPSARAFAAILAHTARLAGKDANIAALEHAGRSLGELVYTLDAYQDLDDDLRCGRFNFLVAQSGTGLSGVKEQVQERARQIAARCLQEMRQAWAEVELRRYRPVLEAVLLTGLSAKTERVLAGGTGRSLSVADDAPQDNEEGRSATQDVACRDKCDYRCCDCCFCPGESDCRCCSECCRHGCYCDDAGCRCGDCSGGDSSGGECTSGGCGHCDCSGSDNCACANCGGDGSSCDCGNCDCSGCDCNCSN